MDAIRFAGVTKRYTLAGRSVVALRDLSVKVEAGEFLAVVGRSGCGKSTFLHLAGAVDLPTSGEVSIEGNVTTGLDDAALTALRRSRIGFVFQFFQLLPTLSAVENVELPLQLAGASNTRRRAMECLDRVEMADFSTHLPHQLSGGQMQRVAIARAIVHSPSLLLADEPLGNLDHETAEGVLRLLHSLNRDLGMSIVMATHSAESTTFADRVATMLDGRFVNVDTLQPDA